MKLNNPKKSLSLNNQVFNSLYIQQLVNNMKLENITVFNRDHHIHNFYNQM